MLQLTRTLLAIGVSFIFMSPGAAVARAQSAAPAETVAPAAPAPLDQATLAKKVDALVNAHMAVNGFSGSVLLARDGKPLVAKGYGYANVEWQVPNTPQTKFRIGSITKQFTSMLIMQLREAGKIKLDDSVCAYVTPCPDTWKPVTIHHLLTHTSGIPSYTGIASWRETNMVPKTVEQLIGVFRDLPVEWTPPGERYAYNNSGYFLLGVVIEKASGKKYEQALKDMILTPLGLNDTGYDWSTEIIPRRASGYSSRGGAVSNATVVHMQHPYSAGALYSTAEDLLKWDQALYTTTLLPEAAKTLMWTPFKNNYAYGWMIVSPSAATFGHKRIMHGGSINGFSSIIMRLPDSNVTAIVLSNNESANAGVIGRELLAIYFGQPYTMPAPTKLE